MNLRLVPDKYSGVRVGKSVGCCHGDCGPEQCRGQASQFACAEDGNHLDKAIILWLNFRVVRTLTRILLLVVLILLPAMLTGPLLEVSGGGCASHSCCSLAHCRPHAHKESLTGDFCREHGHHHHCHVRLQLMREAEHRELDGKVLPAVTQKTIKIFIAGAKALLPAVARVRGHKPPEYTGYLRPRRC